jgi:hypothetical protein
MSKYSIKVYKTEEEFTDVYPYWEKMQTHPNSDIENYKSLIKKKREIIGSHVIAIEENSEPIVLLIGRIEDRHIDIKFGYKILLSPKLRSLTIIYGGILGKITQVTSDLLMKELTDTLNRGEVDIIFFNHLDRGSYLFNAAITQPNILSRDYYPEETLHWKASLLGSYENFYQARSKNTKHNLRRYSKMLSNEYGARVRYVCLREEHEFEKIMKDTEIIAAKTYHRSLGAGFIDDDVTRERVRHALRKGRFRAYMAYIDDAPSAFWNGSIYNDTFFAETTGYAPVFERYHIGTWLFVKMVKELCEENTAFIDFGFGDAQYKQNYCDYNIAEASLYIFSPHVKGILLNMTKSSAIYINQMLAKILIRVKLKDKIKTLWRRKIQKEGQTDEKDNQ